MSDTANAMDVMPVGGTPAAARPGIAAGGQRWPVGREVAVLLPLLVVSPALRLATYSAIADGGWSRYVKTVIVGAVSSLLVWWLVRLQTERRQWVPLACAAAVLLAGDAVHYARVLNPITRGGPVRTFTAAFPEDATLRGQWEIETSAAGRVTVQEGKLLLESPPGAAAYVRARLGALPDPRQSWWLPVALAERERAERFTWRAAVQRTGGFYVVTEVQHLLIQVVPYGIHVTYPDPQKAPRGHEIQHPVGTDGQVHEWQIARDAQQITLSLDGKQVWSAPQQEELNQVKLGETKSDPQHGGTMRVESVSYVSTLIR